MVSVFSYISYQDFLTDLFDATKREKPHFSHRFLASRLDLSSSGYMIAVMKGNRKLTEKLALRIVDYFKLSSKESDYFLLLVRYTHAKSQDEKQYLFNRIIKLKNRVVKDITPEYYRFYEKWYYSAIREVIATMEFNDDFASLSKHLIPAISVSEAKEAVQLLEQLGFIKRDENGIYSRVNQVISTGSSWSSPAIENLQMTLSDLAKESLGKFDKGEREMSNLTLSISRDNIGVIKDKIKELRREILELAAADPTPDSVIQCNFQVFPLTRELED